MSGLGKRGPGGTVVGALQGVFGAERCFCADMFQTPDPSWPISADAPQVVDNQSMTGTARAYDSDVEHGVGFSLSVPLGVTKMYLRLPGRILDPAADEKQVVLRLYARSGAGAWSGAQAIALLKIPNDLVQSVAVSALLGPLGVAPGTSAQFLLTRNPASASDTLVGRWGLYEVGVNFA